MKGVLARHRRKRSSRSPVLLLVAVPVCVVATVITLEVVHSDSGPWQITFIGDGRHTPSLSERPTIPLRAGASYHWSLVMDDCADYLFTFAGAEALGNVSTASGELQVDPHRSGDYPLGTAANGMAGTGCRAVLTVTRR